MIRLKRFQVFFLRRYSIALQSLKLADPHFSLRYSAPFLSVKIIAIGYDTL